MAAEPKIPTRFVSHQTYAVACGTSYHAVSLRTYEIAYRPLWRTRPKAAVVNQRDRYEKGFSHPIHQSQRAHKVTDSAETPSNFTVPPAMDAVVRGYDSNSADLSLHEVSNALHAAIPDANAITDGERRGAYAETLPFGLMTSRGDASPWGTYFGPQGSGQRQDGTSVYFPDIAGADTETLAHWMARAQNLTQPILKARYADVAWEMAPLISGARRDPEMARIAIDAYLAAPSLSPAPDLYHRIEVASRSLHLAILINDQSRVKAARMALVDLHRQAVTSRSQWWNTFDTLINNKRASVTDAERDELVASLESLLNEFADPSDPSKFNPHDAESIVKRLVPIHRRSNKPDEIRRLHTVVGKTFEYFASIADPMLASVVLQTAVDAYRDAGLGDDSKRTRTLMEAKIGAAADAMVPISTDIEIKGEDMEKFLAGVVVDNPGQSLANIAALFLCSRHNLENLIKDVAKESPLQAILTQTIMAADHVAAKVGSVVEDPNGRVIAQAVTSFAFDSLWLHQALATVVDRHALTPHHIVAWANRLALFDDVSFLLEGVAAWYERDTVKALHVLVPQIEAGLRNIVGKLGKPITKPHGTLQGVGVSINMGDILNSKDITEALGPDITLHFLALYADPRGRNLRNNLAHGLITRQAASRDATNWLIHSLLIFGIWDKLAEVRRPRPAATASPSSAALP